MQKKYQIFVSSTFRDLVDERQDTIRHVLDLGHIPAGMELFPAADTEQLEYIKKVIDECDYYVLIIGGRYGSMDDEGVSFTDREYEYALDTGKPVLAFIHGDPGKITVENTDVDPRISARLLEFKSRVSKGRLVKFWTTRESLALAVLKTITKAIQENPQAGWIRGNVAAGEDILQQINSLRTENDQLKNEIAKIKSSISPIVEGLANLGDGYQIEYITSSYYNGAYHYTKHKFDTSWMEIFSVLGPKIFSPLNPSIISTSLKKFIDNKNYNGKTTVDIAAEESDKIKIHLIALNLISAYQANQVNGGVSEFIEITNLGKKTLLETMSVKSKEV